MQPLRITDARFDLFLQVFSPVFVAHDIDGVIHAWVQSTILGGSVAFDLR